MANHICKTCKKQFTVNQRGRPPTTCEACRPAIDLSAKKQAPPTNGMIKAIALKLLEAIDEPSDHEEAPTVPSKVADKVAPLGTYAHEVMVSNMGFAHRGNDEKEALRRYKHYVKASIAGFGQVGKEKVSRYTNGLLTEAFDPLANNFLPDTLIEVADEATLESATEAAIESTIESSEEVST